MPKLEPFDLEDFFYEYEHRPGIINLASSDALPWTFKELSSRFPEIEACVKETRLAYPNVKDKVIPKLKDIYENPPNVVFLPTSGAAEAIYLALQAIHCTLPGRAIIGIPKPAYGAFEGISKLFDYTIKHYSYKKGESWQVQGEDVLELAQQCDVLIVNYPHNPTGRFMDTPLLRQIAEHLETRRTRPGILIVDEVFLLPKDLPKDLPKGSVSSLGIGANLLVISSLSKVYGLPGLRFGWAAGPRDLIDKMRTLQQYVSLSINTFAANVGSIVLSRISDFSRHALLARNRRLLDKWADSHKDVLTITPAEGGTTVVLQILRSIKDPNWIFENLLAERVLLVPGARCFGDKDPTWFRLGYGIDTGKLLDGLERITKVFKQL